MATKAIPVVAAKVAATLTDYPAVIQPSVMTGWTTLTTAEMDSMRMYTDSGLVTEIAREVVSSDELHTLIPSLTTSTTIYGDYDGVRSDYAVGATYGRNAVWADYETVLHGELSSGVPIDSTGNITYTKQTANTPTEVTGVLGEAIDTNSAYWTTNYNPNTSIGTGDFTVQNWNSAPVQGTRQNVMYMGVNGAFQYAFAWQVLETGIGGGLDNLQDYITRDDTAGIGRVTSDAVDGTFQMYHYTRSGTTVNLYEDAGTPTTDTSGENDTALGTGASSVYTFAGLYTTGTFVFAGAIDEHRIRGSELSANWITTEYNNQSDVGAFWGTVTDVGGGVTPYNSARRQFLMMM